MRKLTLLFAILTMILCVVACTPQEVSAPTSTEPNPTISTDTTLQEGTVPDTSTTEGTTPNTTTPNETTPGTNTSVPPESTETTTPSTQPSEPEKEEPPATEETTPKPTEPKPTEPKPTEPPHVHKYTSKETSPTCEKDGKITYTCDCGHSYSESAGKKLGHTYNSTKTESTCSQAGKIVYTCTRCGYSYDESLAKKDHQYKLTNTVESTTSKKGYKEYTCSVCGKSYKEELPLKKGAMETDTCGSSLWLKPLRHGGYYDFATKIFNLIAEGTQYKEAYDKSFPLVDKKMTLVNWFTDTYRYAAYPFSYTVYNTKEGEEHWTIWGEDETYATMDSVHNECKRILREIGVTSGMSQKEAITKINDYLVKTRYYEYDKSKVDGSPEFSIFNSAAICHNYAVAFQMLCLEAGIECHYYSSNTMNHAWNKVYFSDGTYYWVDVCWNDSEKPNRYLLITTEQLLKDHSL